jgi:hypothetical protein
MQKKIMDKIRKKDSSWWYELKRLWNQFDPIGVLGEDSDCPHDEYESYIAPTFALLEKGVGFTELNNYISFIVREYIGMNLSDEYIAELVGKLQYWYGQYELSIAAYLHAYSQPDIKNGVLSFENKKLTSLCGIDQIINKEDVCSINLQKNFLRDLSYTKNHFLGFRNVHTLDFSHNNFSTFPNFTDGEYVFSTLRFLWLSNNQLQGFNSSVLGLGILETLDLSYNEIEKLSAGIFEQLSSLDLLNLSNNKNLKEISPDAFMGLRN